MQVFPSALRDLWTTWELPVMVLFSLFLQVVLIPMGFKRQYSSNNWLQWLLWLAYLSADSVATLSLGILSSGSDSLEPRYVIRALWAPFFLLHLGGPDTITAYSTQDNDLWLRHLLGLLIHAGFTIYIFILSLQPTSLNFVAIPVFVAGMIKYGERTWALRSASADNLRDQEVPFRSMDLSTNYTFKFPIRICIPEESPRFTDLRLLHVAHCFFERSKFVFADLFLSSNDLKQGLYYFLNFDYKSAFKIVELELGFLHDLLYTKASAIHSGSGALLRLTSLSSIVAAIIAFCTSNTHRYPPADVYLTFILLFGALGLEMFSIFLILCSDWSVIRLTQIDNFLARATLKAIHGFGWSVGKARWSNSVPQFNLITHCFEDIHGTHNKLLKMNSCITQITNTASRPISDELKKRIFEQMKEMVETEHENNGGEVADWILTHRRFDGYNHESSIKPNYAQNILILHVATEICYYSVYEKADYKNNSSLAEDTRLVSNFLAYVLAHRPSLFSNAMGRTKFDATINEIKDFLKQKQQPSKLLGSINDAYECILLELNLIGAHDDIELMTSSMFLRGCCLAKRLQELEESERWEEISHEWVEMLVNISRGCKPHDQIELLGHGGDLLAHVWFLTHHLGYTRQSYDISGDEEREIYEFPATAKTSHSF